MKHNYLPKSKFALYACLLMAGIFAFAGSFKLASLSNTPVGKKALTAFHEVSEFMGDYTPAGILGNFFEEEYFANEMKLVKTAESLSNVPVDEVALGSEFYYVLRYENVSGGVINNYEIRDVLPTNISFVSSTIASTTYDAPSRTVSVDIGNVGPGGNGIVRIRVRLEGTALDYRDACTTVISNQARSLYGALDEPSFSSNTEATPTPTVITVTPSSIVDTRIEAICGGDVAISAGNGFDQYTWTRNGAFVANTQTATITQPGIYVVRKEVNCNGTEVVVFETVNVYESTSIANPILPFADDIGVCANNGTEMPNILLCGSEQSRVLNTGFVNIDNVTWERQRATCTSTPNCANTSNACWEPIANGAIYEVSTAGSYRIRLQFQNGCQRVFYFNVYEDQLNASVSSTNYTVASLGSITVNAGGVGPQYTYTLTTPNGDVINVGPTSQNSYTFENLLEGNYSVEVSSDNGCTFTDNVTIQNLNPITFSTTGYNIKDCNRARIRLQRSGGNPPYTFALWSINGEPLYDSFQEIPDSAFSSEESESVGGNQSRVFEILISEQGDYVFVLRDSQGNFAVSNIQTIELDPVYNFEVDTTDVSCYGGNDGSVSLNFTTNEQIDVSILLFDGDTYVVDGTNTPIAPVNTSGTFPNLSAGNYTLEVTISVRRGNSTCTFIRPFEINQPDAPLEAFAGVATDVSCLPGVGASLIRITNASGGTPPYQYNINGTWTNNPEGLRSNDGFVFVRDANGCEHQMYVDVNAANEVPTIQPIVDYNCDGTGNITLDAILNDPNLTYLYEYSLDGAIPVDTNSFENLPPGNYTFTVYYENATPDNPTPAILLEEDFGVGANTTLTNINPVYIYESQVQDQDPPAGDADRMLDDGEYTVTAALQPIGGQQWISPRDADGVSGGRYLAVNIGNVAGEGGVIYRKPIRDITNGADIMVDISVFNLLYASSRQCDPDIIVELVDPAGNIVSSDNTGAIQNDEQWHPVTLTLNSGGNTNLVFQIRSNSICLSGNDIAIDGLRVYQVPEICTANVEVPVVVEESQQFSGQITAQNDISCFGETDGSLEFVVNNFDPAVGFEYSTDGGATWTLSTTSPVTIGGLSVGDVQILIRDPQDNECTFTLDTTTPIGQPDQLGVTFDIAQGISCNPTNPGATIVVQGSGGTAPYEYAITDGTTATPVWQTNNVFTNVPSGTYEVLIRDTNGCTFNATAPVVLENPETILFDVTATQCYAPGNGEITATVTNGNGDYQFSLDNTTWFDAVPAGGMTYTFTGITPGTYTVYVRDGLSCIAQQDVTIAEPIAVSVSSQTNVDCFGSANGEAVFTIANGTAPFTYTLNGGGVTSVTGNTINLTGLSAGSYAVEVTDANGCIASATAVIEAPATALTLNMQVNNLTCDTNSSGSVILTASGGYQSYTYTLTDPNGGVSSNTNGRFNNLTAPGTYQVSVTDAGGCVVTDTFELIPPTPPSLTLASAGCYDGSNTVTITATATGGNGTLQYQLNGGAFQASNTFNVTPGSYTVTVRDSLNCTDTETITIDSELLVSAVAGVLPSCGGTADITASANGGDGNYVFAILPSGQTVTDADFAAGNTTLSVTTAGPYVVYVRDNNGQTEYCEAQTPVTVTQQPGITFTPTPVNITCFGGNNGSISVSATGGTPPYQYSIDGTNYQVSTSFNSLVAGTYTIYVRDSSGCIVDEEVTLTEPADLILSATITADYLCTNSGATIEAIAGGGSGTYEFSLNGGAWVSSGTGTISFNDVTDGTHTIRVRDAAATVCTETTTVTVDPLPVAPVLSAAVEYNCDGSATVTVTPADPTYQYALDGGTFGSSNVFTNVAAGTHTITVNYGSECTIDVPVVVESGENFSAQLIGQTDVSCFGGSDGTLTFSVANFDPAYGFDYSTDGGTTWTNASSSPVTISALSAGPLTVDIRYDASGACITQVPATILQPTQVAVSAAVAVEATCTTGATITATGSGGTPAYEYQLEDATGTTVLSAYSSTRNFSNLAAGDYVVRIRDANGCIAETPITVVAPSPLEATSTATACYAGDNNGSIVVTIDPANTGAVGNGTVYVSLNSGVFVPVNNIPAAGQHTFDGLLPGSYTIDVRDDSSCTVTQLTETIDPQVTATVAVTDISCVAGSITVTASGGDGNFVYAIIPAANTVSDADFSTNNTLSLTTGNDGDYTVYVRDNNGAPGYCDYVETVTVDEIPPVAISATATQPECFGDLGRIALTITNGSLPYDIVLDGGPLGTQTINNFTGTSRNFFNLAAGTYTITVTDNFGCIDTANVVLTAPEELTATVTPIIGDCDDITLNSGFGFEIRDIPAFFTGGDYTIRYDDGSNTFTATSPIFDDFGPGDVVYPAVQVTNNTTGAVCLWEYGRFIVPFPIDDLDISVTADLVSCTQMDVTVQGTQGAPGYEYAYTSDPANFDPATANWTSPPTSGSHIWPMLIPGRTYVFYVRDTAGCIRQSTINVNDQIDITEISGTASPSCFGSNNGLIDFSVNDPNGYLGGSFSWELFDLNDNPIESGNVSSFSSPFDFETTIPLSPGEYYVLLTGTSGCVFGSENILIEEQDPITGTPVKIQDITCVDPGLIEIQSLEGGSGNFTFTLSSPDFTADIVTTDNPVSIPLSQLVDPSLTSVTVTVTAVDEFNCSQGLGSVDLNVAQPPIIDNVTANNCLNEAEIVITASGGLAPYFYSVDGGVTWSNSNTFSDLAVGTYDISVLDSNGCTVDGSSTIEIQPPLQASSEITKLIDCTTSPDGTIEVDITSGSGNYEYLVTLNGAVHTARSTVGVNPLPINTNAPGTYEIEIFDVGTSAPECSVILTETMPASIYPDFTPVAFDVSCFGGSDGSIQVTAVNNGAGPLTYTISPAAGTWDAGTSSFIGLAAGTYTITATGANGCQTSLDETVGEPAELSNLTLSQTPFTCVSGNTPGTIMVTAAGVTGGTGPYTYAFSYNGTTQTGTNTNFIISDLSGGSVSVTVTDANGCPLSGSITIDPVLLLQDVVLTPVNPTCIGNNGTITVDVTSSIAPGSQNLEYDIIQIGGTYSASFSGNTLSHTFPGLLPGNYQVTVTNPVTGCFLVRTTTLTLPPPFEVDAVVTSNVVCDGTNSGVVDINVTNVNDTYTWVITDAANNPVLNGTQADNTGISLGAGDYTVTVTKDSDAACVITDTFSILAPPAPLAAERIFQPITCVGNDGIIEIINVQGGWGGYSYYVGTATPTDTDFTSTTRFTNLAPGTYQVWVRDQEGCALQLQDVILEDPQPITADVAITAPNCDGNSGVITVTNVVGGQGSNYSIQLMRDGVNVGAPAFGTSATFSNLGAGSYSVRIYDQWTCDVTYTTDLTIDEPVLASALIESNISCDPSNANTGGEIRVTATGGTETYTYTGVDPLGNPLTSADGTFPGLTLAGTYTFTVTDANTCSDEVTVTLTDPVIPAIDQVTPSNATCAGNDGSILVTLNPVTAVDPPYTYTLFDSNGVQVSSNQFGLFLGLAPDTYSVTVTSAIGCFVTQTGITIGTDPTPEISLEVSDNCDASGQYSITVSLTQAGIAPYVLSVNGAVRNVTFDSNNEYVITGLAEGTYDIEITDANGCGVTANNNIEIIPLDFLAQVTGLLFCDGPAEITISDLSGSGNYEYAIDGPNGNDLAQTALPASGATWNGAAEAGDYVVTVFDLNGNCSVTRTVNVPVRLEPELEILSFSNQTCASTLDGVINVRAIDNGIGPFTFAITSANGSPVTIAPTNENGYTATFSGLTGSVTGITYEITATAQNGCTETITQVITAPEAIAISDLEVIPFVCQPESNVTNFAQIMVGAGDVTGGSGNYVRYEFIVNGVVRQNSANPEFLFTDLAGGTVTVVAYDDLGCSGTTDVTVDPFIGIENPQLTVDRPVTCVSGEDVTVTVDVVGGTANLQYTLVNTQGTTVSQSPVTTVQTYSFTNLAPGGYFINILNTDTGCEVSLAHTVTDPNNFILTAEENTPVVCFGTATGTVTLEMQDLFLADGDQSGSFDYTITGVTDPSIVISGSSTSSSVVVGGLPAGTFMVEATLTTNGLNCTVPSSEFSIRQSPEPLTATAEEVANVTCTNDQGEIYVDGDGGYIPYTITLTHTGTGAVETAQGVDGYVFTGLGEGNYTATVTDAQGCVVSIEDIVLVRPEFITADITKIDVTCSGSSTGEVSAINVTGGAGPESYFFILNDWTHGTVYEENRTGVFTGLPAGEYSITVYDAWNCDVETERITVTEPNPVSVVEVDKSTVVCYGTSDGYVEVMVSGGQEAYELLLRTSADGRNVDTKIIPTNSGTIIFDGLSGDVEYMLEVRDANGCTQELPVMIPTGPDLSSVTEVFYACEANSPSNWIEVTLPNTTLSPEEVLYALNSTDINDAVLFDEVIDGKGIIRDVTPGASQIITIFYEGCSRSGDDTFEVRAIEPVFLADNSNLEVMNQIEVAASGGEAPYTFYFNGRNLGSQTEYFVSPADPGYTDAEGRDIKVVTVTVIDSNGCEYTIEIEREFIDVEIPPVFTPDGDGNNELWGPENVQNYPRILTRVYDRYGREVGKFRLGEQWDGRYKGAPLPTGDYWYVIKLNGEQDNRKFVGHFTLYR